MSREKTYAGMLLEWQKFLTAMDANPDLAPMTEWRNKLASLLTQGVEISQQQAAMAASQQERSKQLQTLLADGNRLVTGMRKMIADRYGRSPHPDFPSSLYLLGGVPSGASAPDAQA